VSGGNGTHLVRLAAVDKLFRRGAETIHVLDGLDLEIPPGEFLALMGPSGSGKSTLLNLIGGLDRPTSGTVTVSGQRIDQMKERRLAAWRARHVGLVFQFYNLLPVLTAERNVELPLLLTHLSKKERRKHVETALGIVGLAHRHRHYPRQLSGGEQQRVGIARAIVTDPTLLLCDEPTGDLDRASSDGVPSPGAQPESRQDGGDGHPRPARRGARGAHPAPRQGAALRGAGGVKFARLLWANLGRRRLRTFLTVLSILVAFVLYGYLSAIRTAFRSGIEVAGLDRLVVRHKVSIIQLLPESYQRRMERLPGVDLVTFATWFGGFYQKQSNFFAQMPVEPGPFLAMFPEYQLTPEEKKAWLETRTGAIAGSRLAERFGWKVGDRIPIQSSIWAQKDGNYTWELDLVGIYRGAERGTDVNTLFFRQEFFHEARLYDTGMVGWYWVRVADPSRADQIARQIDQEFANSPEETKTEPEGAFVKGFAEQAGNVGLILVAILTAVFFTILLVAGNTMAQAVRERTSELAALKALGFTDRAVLVLVLAESCLLAAVGGLLGLGLAVWLISLGDPSNGAFQSFYFSTRDLLLGILLVLGLGVAAGALPALQAGRLRLADALRR
jgi:putative ABC transport system permease protein